MKKYLITGAMALLAGFYLTSCTHDDIEYSSVYEEKTQTFEKVFHDLYGNIDPNHDWGFKSLNSIAIANSRAAAGTRAAGTRGENANANEWADVSNSTGYGGWKVPPALTEKQKLRVKAYFQANPNLQYKDPHLRNFFVQQVYKGGSDVNPKTSSEVVTAAGGQEYTSYNMNHLTVGQSNVHINNFNRGDATELDVLDNGANLKNHTGETYHKDKIMLMVNIDDTSCFGYHDSGSSNEEKSVNHNDRCALVSASDIDTWAATHGNHIGEAVFSEEWNRSFLGFDLAIKEGDQIWSGETQKFTSGMNMGYDGLYYADDNIVQFSYDENWNRLMPESMDDVMKDKEGKPLKLLVSNTNFYSGDLRTLSDGDLRIDKDGGKVYLNMTVVNNLINNGYYPVSGSAFKTWVKPEKSYDGYFSDWIVTLTQATTVGNTEEINTKPEEHQGEIVRETSTGDEHKLLAIGRVFVEDLFKASREDLDFNDAVFDAAIWQTTTNGTITIVDGKPVFTPSENENSVVTREAEIYLIAAGGTIPLMIANGCPEIGDGSDQKHEVHEIFDVSGVMMVNTRGQYSEAFGSYKNGISPKYKKFNMTAALKDKPEGEITLNDIPVDVIWTTDQFSVPASLNNETIVEYQKDPKTGKYILENDEPVRVNTGVAKAPHIICVPLGTDWATERRNIADCYPAFGDYVGRSNTEYECWNSATQESRFNIYEQNVTTFNKANYGDGETELEPDYAYYTNVQVISNEKEITLWEGNQDFGNSGIVSLATDAFTKNNAKSGDKIRFYLTSSATNYWNNNGGHYNENEWDFNIFTGYEQGYKDSSIYHVYGNSADISKGYYEFTPSAEDIKAFKLELNLGWTPQASLKIQGQRFILTKITLVQ